MNATIPTRTKLQLKDEERSRIRWSSTKRGFVPVADFDPYFSRRGPRAITPLRRKVHVVQDGALDEAISLRERTFYAGRTNRIAHVREVTIYEVDHLGNVLAVHPA